MSLSSLNPEQQKAVTKTEGRILVLAGAGSGKTKVLTYRIAYLIKKGVDPSKILALTFTNKAAREMQERLKSLTEAAKKVTLSTFHSFCVKVLRQEIHHLGFNNHFTLYDERDMRRLVSTLLQEMGDKTSPDFFLSQLSEVKNKNLTSSDAIPNFDQLSQKLNSTLKAYNALDFDSLLSYTVLLFTSYPSILKRYEERYRHLLIDEFQDTNPIQNRLAELLTATSKNLFVVGDDDQSIYGWRGADINHILEFKSDVTIKLEQNYRSTPTILKAANAVIAKNEKRHKKALWSSKEAGEKILLFHASTEEEEAKAVIDKLLYFKAKMHLSFSDFAILYRSNSLSRQFELALMQASYQHEGKWLRNIPYEVYGGLSFAERSEIKDLFSYLRVIVNPQDEEALLRILNVPRRGISDETIHKLKEKKKPLFSLLKEVKEEEFSSRAIKGIRAFSDLIQEASLRFSKKPFLPSLQWLIDAIPLKKAIEEEVKSEKARLYKWDNVLETLNALSIYEEQEEEPTLEDFIAQNALSPEVKSYYKNSVKLMTFHSAKGLEFPVCFLTCLEDRLLPHEKSLEIEEERRLFYVGITRAEKQLVLSMSRSRRRAGRAHPTNPSRFLFDIPKELYEVEKC